jgi:hypothetical protein
MGRITFTAPRVYVSSFVFLARLILTRGRVLDSEPLFGPAYRCRFRFHVDNRRIQYRYLHNRLPLLQGVYHYGWVAHVLVAQTEAG